jgi:hypothetical protein
MISPAIAGNDSRCGIALFPQTHSRDGDRLVSLYAQIYVGCLSKIRDGSLLASGLS